MRTARIETQVKALLTLTATLAIACGTASAGGRPTPESVGGHACTWGVDFRGVTWRVTLTGRDNNAMGCQRLKTVFGSGGERVFRTSQPRSFDCAFKYPRYRVYTFWNIVAEPWLTAADLRTLRQKMCDPRYQFPGWKRIY
jgi:hypothetical protein